MSGLRESANTQDNDPANNNNGKQLKKGDLFPETGKGNLYFIVDPFLQLAEVAGVKDPYHQ